jgi:glycerophosphoryl diester phosphodiesterase
MAIIVPLVIFASMKFSTLFLVLFVMSTSIRAQYIPKFDIQGHRGARGIMPENTIPAFLRAMDLGVTTIELDVVITKDKQVILSHEPWMSSEICLDAEGNTFTPNEEKKYNIFQLTYDEVARFDCGSKGHAKYPAQQKTKTSKPLLKDVIVAVEDHIRSYSIYEVDYNIEIKSTPDGDNKFHPGVEEFSDLVYNLVNEYLPLNRVVIQSFDFRVLRYFNKKYPGVRLAALVENSRSIDANLQELGFKPSIYSPYYKLLNRDQVAYLHRLKIRVIPWTVNEESEMLVFKGMGVDGFITDYPDRARKYKMTLNIQRK